MLIVSTERKGDIMRQDVLNEINIFLRGGEKETMSKAAMARIMGCDPRTVNVNSNFKIYKNSPKLSR